jgi:two-component system, cell cycle response regulator
MPVPPQEPPSDWPDDPEAPYPTVPIQSWGDMDTTLRQRGPDDGVPAPSEWALVVYAGANLGRVFPLQPGVNVIGRSPQASITLLDEEVSRTHSCVHMDPSELRTQRIILEDLHSTNGTFLNGQPVLSPLLLSAGDRITIGTHILKLVAMDPLERAFHETLLDQSTKDPLTGLGNRGAALAELQSRFDLSRRHGRPISVVMCDLDHFKQINDQYGHGAGDIVLAGFGERVRQNLRGTDLAGRIGGEEFLLVLPETEIEGALLLAERLRASLSDTPHQLPSGPIQVTCSLGVAQRNQEDRDAGALLGRADEARYAAKRQGRNQVIVAGTNRG